MSEPRMSSQTLKVLAAIHRAQRISGAEIAKSTRLASGTLYPILLRFEAAGWLRSEWEYGDPTDLGRPRRRYYMLTGVGAEKAAAVVEDLQASIGRLAWS